MQFLRVTFDPDTGLVSGLSNLETKQTIRLTQKFYWSESPRTVFVLSFRSHFSGPFWGCRYNASAGNSAASRQPSGAYIFRPNGTAPFAISETAQTESVQVDGAAPPGGVSVLVGADRPRLCPPEAGGAGGEAALRSLGLAGGPSVRRQPGGGAGVDGRTAARGVSAFPSPRAHP